MKAYNVKLSRVENENRVNNTSFNNNKNEKFYLFDYFDILEYNDKLNKKDKNVDFEDLIFNDNPFNEENDPLKLNLDEFCSQQNIYLFSKDDQENLVGIESKPYIMLLQLSFNEIFYKAYKNEDINTIINNTIIPKIKEISNQVHINNPSDFKIRVFRLISSGDLAVIVRSENVKSFPVLQQAISLISIEFSNLDHKLKRSILFTIYSMVGVEASHTLEKSDFDKKDQIDVRCAYSESMKENLLENIINQELVDPEFSYLIGIYDESVRLNPEDFCNIYPSITSFKFSNSPTNCDEKYKRFKRNILKGYYSAINERIFFHDVNLNIYNIKQDMLIVKANQEISQEQSIDKKISEQIDKITTNISNLHKSFFDCWEDVNIIPPQIESNANELIRILKQVNASIFSRIKQNFNAMIALELISVLIDSTEKYFVMYKTGEISEPYFLENLNSAVSMIGKYVNQMYIVNLNNYESPIYSMNLASAIEKTSIAYSEFLRIYYDDYCKLVKEQTKLCYRSLVPLVQPNSDVSIPVLDTVFTGIEHKANEKHKRLINVISPSFEMMTKPEEIISSFAHEIGHFFPVEERAKRNLLYARLTIYRLSVRLYSEIFPQQTDFGAHYYSIRKIFINEFLETFYSQFESRQDNTLEVEEEIFAEYSENISYYFEMIFSGKKCNFLDSVIDLFDKSLIIIEKSDADNIPLMELEEIVLKLKIYREKCEIFNIMHPLHLVKKMNKKISDDFISLFENFIIKYIDFIKIYIKKYINKNTKSFYKIAPNDLKNKIKNKFNSLDIIEPFENNEKVIREIIEILTSETEDYLIDNKIRLECIKLRDIEIQKLVLFINNFSEIFISFEKLDEVIGSDFFQPFMIFNFPQKIRNIFFVNLFNKLNVYIKTEFNKHKCKSYFKVFYEMGVYSENNPEEGKKIFISKAEASLIQLFENQHINISWNESRTLFREVVADLIMIFTCDINIESYKNVLKRYNSELQNNVTKDLHHLREHIVISILKKHHLEDMDFCKCDEISTNKFDNEYSEFSDILYDDKLMNEFFDYSISIKNNCRSIVKNEDYLSLKSIFSHPRKHEENKINSEIAFIFDWYYYNRSRLCNNECEEVV